MGERTCGATKRGEPIDDAMIQELPDEAEHGNKPGQLQNHRRGPGRRPLGRVAKLVEPVRLEPDLQAGEAEKAAAEGVSVSEVIRRALRLYLRSV